MTVAEVKAKLPEAEVYELRPDARYLMVVHMGEVPLAAIEDFDRALHRLGIRACYLRVAHPPEAIRILELEED